MRADPETFRAAARSVRQVRDVLRSDRTALTRETGVFAHWVSDASEQFYQQRFLRALRIYHDRADDLESLAVALDEAAAALEAQISRIHGLERRIDEWFDHNRPSDGSPPRWEVRRWRYRPGLLPPTGDSEWLAASRWLQIP